MRYEPSGLEGPMPLSASDKDLGQSTRVWVHLANHGGGWVLLVERDGQIVTTVHCTDWHRVERRRNLLEVGTIWRTERVAAPASLDSNGGRSAAVPTGQQTRNLYAEHQASAET
jgi:hypothetical protein